MKAYIKKIAYYLPEHIECNPEDRLSRKTGICKRHICSQKETASDLAYYAAVKIFEDGVKRDDVDFLLLCTQSPDYFLPTTACILQNRLGLKESCGAMDFNLGCSGYVYGLSLAKGLIESGQVRNVLFLTAETYSKYIHPKDNTVRPLFGDAATATFIEGVRTEEEGLKGFVFGTKGSGYDNLIVPIGGMREPYESAEKKEEADAYGNVRTRFNLYMKGSAISDFALDVVPPTVEEVLIKCHLKKHEIDYYVFHQANKFMLNYLQQKCSLDEYPYWNDVKNYGNTVSSSIPIALCDMLNNNHQGLHMRVLIVGFGVGLSWGGCVIRV